jgi:hypothetical protein
MSFVSAAQIEDIWFGPGKLFMMTNAYCSSCHLNEANPKTMLTQGAQL